MVIVVNVFKTQFTYSNVFHGIPMYHKAVNGYIWFKKFLADYCNFTNFAHQIPRLSMLTWH